jgi:hypothetical protein
MKSFLARAFAPGCLAAIFVALVAGFAPAPAAAFSLFKKAPPAPQVEPEIPVGQPVLASQVIDQAAAYALYMNDAGAISPSFSSGAAVSSALRIGVHSEQRQMQRGMVAYAAVVALQDKAFTDAVREFAKHKSTRDAITRYILADPNYVMTLNGHDSAAGLIVATIGGQATRVRDAGELVRRSAYDIQLKAKWSKKAVPDPASRLEEAKTLSTTPLTAPDDLRAALTMASVGQAPLSVTEGPARPPYSQAVIRGMAIAALAVLGQAGDENMANISALMVNDGDGFCFNLSKLNLYQCLSVAKPYYEDIFCLGLHAMMDTGQCVISAIGAGEAAPVPPTLIAAAGVAPSASADPPAASGKKAKRSR